MMLIRIEIVDDARMTIGSVLLHCTQNFKFPYHGGVAGPGPCMRPPSSPPPLPPPRVLKDSGAGSATNKCL